MTNLTPLFQGLCNRHDTGSLLTYLFLLFFFHGILDNVKALYRRARAHVGAWNPEQAKNDFKKAAELDSGLEVTCRKELKRVEEMEKDKDKDDQEKMRNLF